MAKKIYVTVAGTMGSGKTTVARLLSQKLKLHLLEENFGENVFLPRFYKNMKRWAFHSQTFFLMEKINQTLNTKKLLSEKLVIQDTPIEQDVFSYAKAQNIIGNLDDSEWRLYQKIYLSFAKYFPRPNLVIFLENSLPVLVKRVKNRGRTYEQTIPEKYIKLLDNLNHKWLANGCRYKILQINTDDLNLVKNKKDQQTFLDIVQKKLKM